MQSIIKELWRRNVMPPVDSRHHTRDETAIGNISRHNDDLLKTMSDEQKEISEKFHDCWNEYASLSDEALFEYAFKLGARLSMEMQSEDL